MNRVRELHGRYAHHAAAAYGMHSEEYLGVHKASHQKKKMKIAKKQKTGYANEMGTTDVVAYASGSASHKRGVT